MKINVNQDVMNFDGEPIKTSADVCETCGQTTGDEKSLTFRDVIVRGLMATDPTAQKPPSFEDNMERWKLAKRVKGNDIVNMSATEAKKIQTHLCYAQYSALVVGQVGTCLNGDDNIDDDGTDNEEHIE